MIARVIPYVPVGLGLSPPLVPPADDEFASDEIFSEPLERLRRYLLLGDLSRGVVGLWGTEAGVEAGMASTQPGFDLEAYEPDANAEGFDGLRFVQREGTGVAGDETVYIAPGVIFEDDLEPGGPHLRLELLGSEAGPVVGSSLWRIRLTSSARVSEGALTAGVDARSAENLLASWARRMLTGESARRVVNARGFWASTLSVEDARNAAGNFSNPLLFSFTAVEQ